MPVADGGEGTVEALAPAGFSRVAVTVTGPTGHRVEAAFGRRQATAVVELAEASGLLRLPGARLEPMLATTRGTGELIRAALDVGCRNLILTVGGSAGTDGGAGMLQALGARLLDARGEEIRPGGAGLAALSRIDLSGLDPRLSDVSLTLATDVDNPLLGPHGAAAVYAPQKGATPAQVEALEHALRRWAGELALVTGRDRSQDPGSGAAGGTGLAALSVLGATRRPGVDLVLELIGFEDMLPGARLVITGEGCLDGQSLRGKAPVGVAAVARTNGIPAVAMVGRLELPHREVVAAGFAAAYDLRSIEPDTDSCRRQAGSLLERLAGGSVVPEWLAS